MLAGKLKKNKSLQLIATAVTAAAAAAAATPSLCGRSFVAHHQKDIIVICILYEVRLLQVIGESEILSLIHI